MSTKKKKFYVVWDGYEPGIYETWDECKVQIKNYPQAKYKSFPDKASAEDAFNMGFYEFYKLKNRKSIPKNISQDIIMNSICVDAASSGNPGKMEYRGVKTQSRKILFHQGPFHQATNNIGEFLALVHGLAFLKKHGSSRVLYSDSKIAMSWVRQKRCKTKLKKTKRNADVFELVERAEIWLKTHTYSTQILKWETKQWGEIPADFGRK